jgi:preprotein translocase subunit SecD
MKWGRFGTFLVTALVTLGLTAGTTMTLWKSIPLGLDLKGGFDLLYKVEPGSNGQAPTAQGIQAAVQAVQLRVNSTGVASPIIQLENKDQIRVELAGTFDQQKAEEIIGETAQLEIYGDVTQTKDGKVVPSKGAKPLETGNDLESNSQWAVNQQNGQNVVELTFKDPKKWGNITTKYVGKPIYTFLNGKLINSATVQEPILNGQTEISGIGTQQECQTLANELNAGALPYPLKLISSTFVGPSLGAASLNATLYAGGIAIILIFLFMILIYKLVGLIADIALVAYGYVTLVVFAGMHITLTLPGLAALVLGIGMAVDANIIWYERINDEFHNGKSIQSSAIAGNRNALRAIIDSNATTFIAGAVMYWFGQGDIRGFAVALMISIIVSMLTAVALSRFMVMNFIRANVTRKPWLFGIRKGAVER